mgnify:CR=1 FL=1
MIAFNRGYKPNKKDLDEKIQKILDKIFEEENFGDEGYLDQSTNLSEITDLIYQKLFVDNKNSINLSIYKNPNNSLDVIVEKLD